MFTPRVFVRGPAYGLLGVIVFLQACTTTPSIETETKSVPVSEIVERVKCEIWLATKDRLADRRFAFLRKWDATVDLTLLINDQAGINPGVSAINPLNTVTLAGKGSFGQSFSLGFGGGVTGQANLSDTVSFSLSLNELATTDRGLNDPYRRNEYYHLCAPLQETDLIGKLRFKEWIDQALAPIADPTTGFRYLTSGVHPSVQGGGAKAFKMAALFQLQGKGNEIEEKKKKTAIAQQSDLEKQKSTIQDAQRVITSNQLPHDTAQLDNFIADRIDDLDQAGITNIVKDFRKNVTAAKKPPTPAVKNDPLDTISHQIQFIVTWNANATPSWSLVNVKGPGPTSGTFLTGQHQTTHQLLITMGPVKSTDVQNVRQAQQFNAALQHVTVSPAQ